MIYTTIHYTVIELVTKNQLFITTLENCITEHRNKTSVVGIGIYEKLIILPLKLTRK